MSEWKSTTLEDLRKKMAEFARERDWDQFHSPRNLLLALIGKIGELSEIFQWKGEVPKGLPDWREEEKEHLGEELSDVLLYLVRFSHICGVDLGKAALRKMELNAGKYPVKLNAKVSEESLSVANENGNLEAPQGFFGSPALADGQSENREPQLEPGSPKLNFGSPRTSTV